MVLMYRLRVLQDAGFTLRGRVDPHTVLSDSHDHLIECLENLHHTKKFCLGLITKYWYM